MIEDKINQYLNEESHNEWTSKMLNSLCKTAINSNIDDTVKFVSNEIRPKVFEDRQAALALEVDLRKTLKNLEKASDLLRFYITGRK